MKIFRARTLLASLVTAVSVVACGHYQSPPASPAVPASAALLAHTQEFRREIVKVTTGVYVAVGYAISNAIFIEGNDGVIVVDATSSEESAKEVLSAFRTISSKPIKALIYTHSHPDHIGGGAVFAPAGSGIPVYAHVDVEKNYSAFATELAPILSQRAQQMYGTHLLDRDRPNIGIGPRVDMGPEKHFALAAPTKTFEDSLSVEISGVKLELVHAPGETDDQIFVWLPAQKVLLPGDNLYRAFPNLYSIRGTTYRDPQKWASSLDKMRELAPAFLVPSHTRPIIGADLVKHVLTDYRDAIRYVYEQSIRMMNQGLTPDEMAHRITLPPHLASSPWLQEFYGKASWSARSIFAGQLGWFDGNPTHLDPLEPTDEAQHMVALAGGEAAINQAVRSALLQHEYQWALQLSEYALRQNPKNTEAKSGHIEALEARARAESNPNARYYYLSEVMNLRGGMVLSTHTAAPRPETTASIPLSAVFDGLAGHLDAVAAADIEKTVVFIFSDVPEIWSVTLRRGVTEIKRGDHDHADIRIRVSSQVFKEVLAGIRAPVLSIAKDFEFEKGSRIDFGRFMSVFKP